MKTARDLMTENVVTILPDTPLRDLALIFLENNISGVPVVDNDGRVLGIATESDLIFHTKRLKVPAVLPILDSFILLDSTEKIEKELRKIGAASVQDIYSSPAITLKPDTLPVVDDSGKMIGIVGKKDIIRTIL